MAFIVSLFFAFVPAFIMAMFIYWLDRYEKEPLALLGAAFFWGAVVAAGGATWPTRQRLRWSRRLSKRA